MAVDRPIADAEWQRLFEPSEVEPRQSRKYATLRRTAGPEVVFQYPGIGSLEIDQLDEALRARLGADCTPYPVEGLAIVSCPARG